MRRLLLLGALAASIPANAVLVDFEACGNAAQIVAGYGGLIWTDYSWALNGTTYNTNPSGYYNGRVSGNMVGYTFGASAFGWSTLDGTNFASLGIWMTAAWRTGVQVYVELRDGGFGGTVIYSGNPFASPSTTSAMYISPGFDLFTTGFDTMILDPDDNSGVKDPNLNPDGDGAHLVFDNLEYTLVPEPATLAVLGIGALALLRRKR